MIDELLTSFFHLENVWPNECFDIGFRSTLLMAHKWKITKQIYGLEFASLTWGPHRTKEKLKVHRTSVRFGDACELRSKIIIAVISVHKYWKHYCTDNHQKLITTHHLLLFTIVASSEGNRQLVFSVSFPMRSQISIPLMVATTCFFFGNYLVIKKYPFCECWISRCSPIVVIIMWIKNYSQ